MGHCSSWIPSPDAQSKPSLSPPTPLCISLPRVVWVDIFGVCSSPQKNPGPFRNRAVPSSSSLFRRQASAVFRRVPRALPLLMIEMIRHGTLFWSVCKEKRLHSRELLSSFFICLLHLITGDSFYFAFTSFFLCFVKSLKCVKGFYYFGFMPSTLDLPWM